MPRQYEKYFVDPFSGFRGRRGQSTVISQKLEKNHFLWTVLNIISKGIR